MIADDDEDIDGRYDNSSGDDNDHDHDQNSEDDDDDGKVDNYDDMLAIMAVL